MDSFLASIQVLPWGTDEAEVYGTIRAKLEKKGITLGNMDMMIAAHAIVNKATLDHKRQSLCSGGRTLLPRKLGH